MNSLVRPSDSQKTQSLKSSWKMSTASTTTNDPPKADVPVKEFLFKLLVVGDLGTGKTSIIKRYVHQIFSMHYKSTVRFSRPLLSKGDS